jgi:cold shock protein
VTTGTVTWALAGRRYGFVAPDGSDRELFVTASDMSAHSTPLRVGARVDFEEQRGAHGRTAAANVTVRPTAEPSSAEEADVSAAEWEGMPSVPEAVRPERAPDADDEPNDRRR